ncbi:MAG: phosphoserine phosphatase SerB [Arachnia propionica]|uniref:phosphoserine phosphatase SerB n=1 Tax=Arachnia propionica TaxID=1750 RepID=UPI00270C01B9|nr:phosphoserine phosphatase SerB [Arachnia propionica]
MRARVVALHPQPAPLPFDAEWREAPFGALATATPDLEDPEQLRLDLVNAGLSGAVITGPLADRPARLVLCDVDSTLTTTEAVDLIAEHAGTGAEVAAITERAMRGELDFETSLRQRVATLEGLPVSVLAEVLPRMTLAPGARELITALHDAGVVIGVTSGGFSPLVQPLAEDLGLDFWNANGLGVRDGVLTGQVTGVVVDRAQKARDLARFADRHGVPRELTVAIGDGANDLAMLAAAGLGVAYCAKPLTAAQADAVISFPRLDAVAALTLP